jgi:hypothetical protein
MHHAYGKSLCTITLPGLLYDWIYMISSNEVKETKLYLVDKFRGPYIYIAQIDQMSLHLSW